MYTINSLIKAHRISSLRYPQDRWQLAFLPLEALQTWYAAQDAREMVYLGQSEDFQRFWHIVYVLPTRFYRFLLKIKRFAFKRPQDQVPTC